MQSLQHLQSRLHLTATGVMHCSGCGIREWQEFMMWHLERIFCTWAHIRYLEQHPNAKILSQPCAVIVNYVVKHRITAFKESLSDPESRCSVPQSICENTWDRPERLQHFLPCIAKRDEFKQTQFNLKY